jgi:hypothetical protein
MELPRCGACRRSHEERTETRGGLEETAEAEKTEAMTEAFITPEEKS